MRKKILSAVLCLAMAVSLAPTMAFADNNNAATSTDAEAVTDVETDADMLASAEEYDVYFNGDRVTSANNGTVGSGAVYDPATNTVRIVSYPDGNKLDRIKYTGTKTLKVVFTLDIHRALSIDTNGALVIEEALDTDGGRGYAMMTAELYINAGGAVTINSKRMINTVATNITAGGAVTIKETGEKHPGEYSSGPVFAGPLTIMTPGAVTLHSENDSINYADAKIGSESARVGKVTITGGWKSEDGSSTYGPLMQGDTYIYSNDAVEIKNTTGGFTSWKYLLVDAKKDVNISSTSTEDGAGVVYSSADIKTLGDVNITATKGGLTYASNSNITIEANNVTMKTSFTEAPAVNTPCSIKAKGDVSIENTSGLAVTTPMDIDAGGDVSIIGNTVAGTDPDGNATIGAPTVSSPISIKTKGDFIIANKGDGFALYGTLSYDVVDREVLGYEKYADEDGEEVSNGASVGAEYQKIQTKKLKEDPEDPEDPEDSEDPEEIDPATNTDVVNPLPATMTDAKKTGDDAALPLAGGMLLFSLCAVASIYILRKKRTE